MKKDTEKTEQRHVTVSETSQYLNAIRLYAKQNTVIIVFQIEMKRKSPELSTGIPVIVFIYFLVYKPKTGIFQKRRRYDGPMSISFPDDPPEKWPYIEDMEKVAKKEEWFHLKGFFAQVVHGGPTTVVLKLPTDEQVHIPAHTFRRDTEYLEWVYVKTIPATRVMGYKNCWITNFDAVEIFMGNGFWKHVY